MEINAHTKIAFILKQHPQALEAIVGISPHFEKLRNPLLRKLMAGRTSIATAAKIGGCTVDHFYSALKPLGFIVVEEKEKAEAKKNVPAFMLSVKKENLVALDVRPDIAAGHDPLNKILETVKELKPGQVLKIINTFEPAPLMQLLQKKGFESYAEEVAPQWVETFFYQKEKETFSAATKIDTDNSGLETKLKTYEGRLHTVDVRHLPMPQPMHTILEKLETLPDGEALLVHHKRIPVFLLPELADRGFDVRIEEVNDSEVYLLIFRK